MTDAFDTADLYDCDSYAESYTHTTPQTAVERAWEEYLRDHDPRAPEAITVFAFKRAEWLPAETLAAVAIEAIVRECEEPLLDPENPVDVHDAVAAAALALAEAWRTHQKVWHCERVGERTMTLAQWLTAPNPR